MSTTPLPIPRCIHCLRDHPDKILLVCSQELLKCDEHTLLFPPIESGVVVVPLSSSFAEQHTHTQQRRTPPTVVISTTTVCVSLLITYAGYFCFMTLTLTLLFTIYPSQGRATPHKGCVCVCVWEGTQEKLGTRRKEKKKESVHSLSQEGK